MKKEPDLLQTRNATARWFVTGAVATVLGVVIFRVILPALIDAHSDIGMAGAVVVVVLTGLAGIWLAFNIVASLRNTRDAEDDR